MKKIVTSALVLGLLAVPSVALAQHGADDTSTVAHVHREDRQEDHQADRRLDNRADDSLHHQVTVSGQSSAVRVENKVTPATSSITLDQATAAAQTAMPGKTVAKVEVESEEGVTVYSVRFTDGSRVDVRASDGQVVRNKVNDDSSDQDRSGHSGRDHAEDN